MVWFCFGMCVKIKRNLIWYKNIYIYFLALPRDIGWTRTFFTQLRPSARCRTRSSHSSRFDTASFFWKKKKKKKPWRDDLRRRKCGRFYFFLRRRFVWFRELNQTFNALIWDCLSTERPGWVSWSTLRWEYKNFQATLSLYVILCARFRAVRKCWTNWWFRWRIV